MSRNVAEAEPCTQQPKDFKTVDLTCLKMKLRILLVFINLKESFPFRVRTLALYETIPSQEGPLIVRNISKMNRIVSFWN